MTSRRTFRLREYIPALLPAEVLPLELGERLWRTYGDQVAVEFPSPKTDFQWRLVSQGWVGRIPLASDFDLILEPKVPIINLFRMLEYAYGISSFRFLEGLADVAAIDDVYERLAHVLARRVLDRARRGLYRTYLPKTDALPFVRGRMDATRLMRKPWRVRPHCRFDEHTPDIPENQILAWTLFVLARGGLRRPEVVAAVRKAFRALRGSIDPVPFTPFDCTGRTYSRLNQDYEPMHALCRFFLDHAGPGLQTGDRKMLPFLVDMAQLFEAFVAAWLQVHLPTDLRLKIQQPVRLSDAVALQIDLVLYDRNSDGSTGSARCVLDTKYKDAASVSNADIYQVVTYALAKRCKEAILVYPSPPANPIDLTIHDIRVRSIGFDLAGDLESTGAEFLQAGLPVFRPQAQTQAR